MVEPSAKRPKIDRGQDDYMPGNIIEIELHKFMTFDFLRCKLAPRLNLVIGPNGSGKSSLVCAIALGLGGEPKLLGRATSIGAYVKRGEKSGYVKITLRGDTKEEHLTIKRKISKNNKSEWSFNGKVVSKRDVLEIIQRFNIQVNNLTQFLPQDRVCEFAKLTSVQLLEETEKAVGDPELPIHHHKLVDKSRALKHIELTAEKNEGTLNQLKERNAELEKDVERIRQREELQQKAESMKKKLPWLRYGMKKAEYNKAKKQQEDAEKKLVEAEKTLNDLKKPIEKHKEKKALLDAECESINHLISDNAKKRMDLLDRENQLDVELKGKYREMEDLRRWDENHQCDLLKAKQELAAAELEVENLPHYGPPKDKIERLRAACVNLNCSASQMSSEKEGIGNILIQRRESLKHFSDRLRDMDNKTTRCLLALRNSGAEKVFDAYKWVQEHRHEFNKEVYGPILLEVNVPNEIQARFLEGQVANYIWKSFITQDRGDRDLLVKNLKSFDVPVLNHTGDDHRQRKPFDISEDIHAVGIYARLDQVFYAPTAVKEVLIGQFGLDRSYIGSEEADQKADAVQQLGILDFWTPVNHYRWIRSRYGDHHVSGIVEPVGRSELFLCNTDVREIEKLKSQIKELEEDIANLEASSEEAHDKERSFRKEADKLHKEWEEILDKTQKERKIRRDIIERIERKKRRLQLMEEENDKDMAMAKLIDQAANCNIQRFHNAIKIKNLQVEAVVQKRTFAEKRMASIEFEVKIKESESNLKQYERLAVEASSHLENCRKGTENCRRQMSDFKRHAESIAPITPVLKKAFLEMPGTIEELQAAIQDTISEANSIFFLNHNIVEEYKCRQSQIEDLATKLEADKQEVKRFRAEVDELKEKWLPTLRNLVTQINETFSRNFGEMAVAGEVVLDEHGMDFDHFGILIKVKFRPTGQLRVLSAHHQSGGERSVSTILYLVSLQDLTNCPFRVVDEINQGMDPINERKMFVQLVRASSQPNTPQCFLLTPKLLPDLHYSEACSILNVMNGPWIEQPLKVWSSGDSWGKITGLVGDTPC